MPMLASRWSSLPMISLGVRGRSLVTMKTCLRTSGSCWNHCWKSGSDWYRSEVSKQRMPWAYAYRRIRWMPRPPARPRVEDGDVDPGLAQRPPGDRQRLRGLVGEGMAPGPQAGGRNRGRGDGPGLEERAAIGAVRRFVGHGFHYLDETGGRSRPDAGQRRSTRAAGSIGRSVHGTATHRES